MTIGGPNNLITPNPAPRVQRYGFKASDKNEETIADWVLFQRPLVSSLTAHQRSRLRLWDIFLLRANGSKDEAVLAVPLPF